MDQGSLNEIQIFEVGSRRLYVKTGTRNFAISEDDLTPEELLRIASDIAARKARRAKPQIEIADFTAQRNQSAA